jgi:hypothetical protein
MLDNLEAAVGVFGIWGAGGQARGVFVAHGVEGAQPVFGSVQREHGRRLEAGAPLVMHLAWTNLTAPITSTPPPRDRRRQTRSYPPPRTFRAYFLLGILPTTGWHLESGK